MLTSALALIDDSQYSLMSKLAVVAAKSGYAGKNEAQVMFIFMKGFELGISPMQALDGITVIQNKTTVSPQLMLALINRSGELADIKIEPTDAQCTVTMTRKGRSPNTAIFSMDDARKMKLDTKDNWIKQPKVMMQWRAIAACARVAFPDIIQGMYTPEELGAAVDMETGDVIEGTVTEAPIASLPQSTIAPISETEAPAVIVKTDEEKTLESHPDANPVWQYDFTALMARLTTMMGSVANQPRLSKERADTIKKMHEAGDFDDVSSLDAAAGKVQNRLLGHRKPKPETEPETKPELAASEIPF